MFALLAVALVVIIACVVFTVDVAYMQLARTELRTAVDAAARSGAEALSRTQKQKEATKAAIATAKANTVAGKPFTLQASDISFGRVALSNTGISSFQAGGKPMNAVRVKSGRTAKRPDGAVTLWFGQFLGRKSFEPVQTATAAQLDRDIALVLDVSGSMNDFNKFAGLKDAVSAFCAELDGTPQTEQVSLTTYSTTATKDVDLTPTVKLIQTAMNSKTAAGWTAIGEGLKLGIKSLQTDSLRRPLADPVIILMTDGIHNTGVTPDVVMATAPKNITVHTITFGLDADQAAMQNVAKLGRGKHFHAPKSADLKNIFREIATGLPVVLTE